MTLHRRNQITVIFYNFVHKRWCRKKIGRLSHEMLLQMHDEVFWEIFHNFRIFLVCIFGKCYAQIRLESFRNRWFLSEIDNSISIICLQMIFVTLFVFVHQSDLFRHETLYRRRRIFIIKSSKDVSSRSRAINTMGFAVPDSFMVTPQSISFHGTLCHEYVNYERHFL